MGAVYGFLIDETTGLNAETLPAMRTALSVDSSNLPDVAVFERWYHRSSQATAFPYMSIIIDSTSAESAPNSRLYTVDFTVALVVLDANVDGDEADVVTALWRYGDALKTIFQRRTPAAKQGWTLDGATGIIRAEITDQTPGADPTIAAPNVALLTGLSVVTAEEF